MDRYRRGNMRFRANTLPEETMSKRNREYKDVVQKLVGRQTNAARGSPDHQRRLQQRQMLQQLRQHVSEARYETGEAVSHIQEEMYKMGARLDHPDSLEHEEGQAAPPPDVAAGEPAGAAPKAGAGITSQSSLDKYQSETMRAMQDLILKRQQSHEHDVYDPETSAGHSVQADGPSSSHMA